MAYLTTNRRLVGKYIIKRHAVSRLKSRYGDTYIGNKKIKNMNSNKLVKKIRYSLGHHIMRVKENKDGSLYVVTNRFKVVIRPGFNNHVVTILPKERRI